MAFSFGPSQDEDPFGTAPLHPFDDEFFDNMPFSQVSEDEFFSIMPSSQVAHDESFGTKPSSQVADGELVDTTTSSPGAGLPANDQSLFNFESGHEGNALDFSFPAFHSSPVNPADLMLPPSSQVELHSSSYNEIFDSIITTDMDQSSSPVQNGETVCDIPAGPELPHSSHEPLHLNSDQGELAVNAGINQPSGAFPFGDELPHTLPADINSSFSSYGQFQFTSGQDEPTGNVFDDMAFEEQMTRSLAEINSSPSAAEACQLYDSQKANTSTPAHKPLATKKTATVLQGEVKSASRTPERRRRASGRTSSSTGTVNTNTAIAKVDLPRTFDEMLRKYTVPFLDDYKILSHEEAYDMKLYANCSSREQQVSLFNKFTGRVVELLDGTMAFAKGYSHETDQGDYLYPPASNPDYDFDKTSLEETWPDLRTNNSANVPLVIAFIDEPRMYLECLTAPVDETPKPLCNQDNQPQVGINGEVLRNIAVLPRYISSAVEGWRLHYWFTMDTRVRYSDILARMHFKCTSRGGEGPLADGTHLVMRQLQKRVDSFRIQSGILAPLPMDFDPSTYEVTQADIMAISKLSHTQLEYGVWWIVDEKRGVMYAPPSKDLSIEWKREQYLLPIKKGMSPRVKKILEQCQPRIQQQLPMPQTPKQTPKKTPKTTPPKKRTGSQSSASSPKSQQGQTPKSSQKRRASPASESILPDSVKRSRVGSFVSPPLAQSRMLLQQHRAAQQGLTTSPAQQPRTVQQGLTTSPFQQSRTVQQSLVASPAQQPRAAQQSLAPSPVQEPRSFEQAPTSSPGQGQSSGPDHDIFNSLPVQQERLRGLLHMFLASPVQQQEFCDVYGTSPEREQQIQEIVHSASVQQSFVQRATTPAQPTRPAPQAATSSSGNRSREEIVNVPFMTLSPAERRRLLVPIVRQTYAQQANAQRANVQQASASASANGMAHGIQSAAQVAHTEANVPVNVNGEGYGAARQQAAIERAARAAQNGKRR